MQSADEEWEDEEWEDEDDSSFFSGVSVASRMKAGGIASVVVLLLLCSLIFTNFGFYSGAGSLSVLIVVILKSGPSLIIYPISYKNDL